MTTFDAIGVHIGHLGGFHGGGGGGRLGSFFAHAAIFSLLRHAFVAYPAAAWPITLALIAAIVIFAVRRSRRHP